MYVVSDDPCADVVCQNGGTCASGVCECPVGYNGDLCEIGRTKMILKQSYLYFFRLSL